MHGISEGCTTIKAFQLPFTQMQKPDVNSTNGPTLETMYTEANSSLGYSYLNARCFKINVRTPSEETDCIQLNNQDTIDTPSVITHQQKRNKRNPIQLS